LLGLYALLCAGFFGSLVFAIGALDNRLWWRALGLLLGSAGCLWLGWTTVNAAFAVGGFYRGFW
jgi:hypothetical protein